MPAIITYLNEDEIQRLLALPHSELKTQILNGVESIQFERFRDELNQLQSIELKLLSDKLQRLADEADESKQAAKHLLGSLIKKLEQDDDFKIAANIYNQVALETFHKKTQNIVLDVFGVSGENNDEIYIPINKIPKPTPDQKPEIQRYQETTAIIEANPVFEIENQRQTLSRHLYDQVTKTRSPQEVIEGVTTYLEQQQTRPEPQNILDVETLSFEAVMYRLLRTAATTRDPQVKFTPQHMLSLQGLFQTIKQELAASAEYKDFQATPTPNPVQAFKEHKESWWAEYQRVMGPQTPTPQYYRGGSFR